MWLSALLCERKVREKVTETILSAVLIGAILALKQRILT